VQPHQSKHNNPTHRQPPQKQKQQPRPASNSRVLSPADRAQLSLKELHRIVKKARAFETRKVVRKLKELRGGSGNMSSNHGSADDAADASCDDSDAESDQESTSAGSAKSAADPAEVAKLETDLALIKVDNRLVLPFQVWTICYVCINVFHRPPVMHIFVCLSMPFFIIAAQALDIDELTHAAARKLAAIAFEPIMSTVPASPYFTADSAKPANNKGTAAAAAAAAPASVPRVPERTMMVALRIIHAPAVRTFCDTLVKRCADDAAREAKRAEKLAAKAAAPSSSQAAAEGDPAESIVAAAAATAPAGADKATSKKKTGSAAASAPAALALASSGGAKLSLLDKLRAALAVGGGRKKPDSTSRDGHREDGGDSDSEDDGEGDDEDDDDERMQWSGSDSDDFPIAFGNRDSEPGEDDEEDDAAALSVSEQEDGSDDDAEAPPPAKKAKSHVAATTEAKAHAAASSVNASTTSAGGARSKSAPSSSSASSSSSVAGSSSKASNAADANANADADKKRRRVEKLRAEAAAIEQLLHGKEEKKNRMGQRQRRMYASHLGLVGLAIEYFFSISFLYLFHFGAQIFGSAPFSPPTPQAERAGVRSRRQASRRQATARRRVGQTELHGQGPLAAARATVVRTRVR
jgi:hypothetical protein